MSAVKSYLIAFLRIYTFLFAASLLLNGGMIGDIFAVYLLCIASIASLGGPIGEAINK